MYEAAVSRFEEVDAVIGAAAPADYKPAEVSPVKIKKTEDAMTITLVKTPDIIKTLGQTKTRQKVVGFAAETQDVEQYARQKLVDKNMDMIVANDVSANGLGFGSDYNAVKIIRQDGNLKEVPRMPKEQVAHIILDELADLFEDGVL
jgi:phosphopantothenoylcysteine decarboxylase/phosphopantothenate--cysteine ligase